MANFYISDLHLFCKSELRNGYFKERPFDTLEEMHETIKNNWNSTVTNGDHVYILGDNSKRGYNENLCGFLSQLKGNLHMIRGNHDDLSDLRMQKQFVEICDYKEISDVCDGKTYKLILCHYPIYAWNGQHRGAIHLYGHCHDNFDDTLYQIVITKLNQEYQQRKSDQYIPFHAFNVGCMHWNYTPVTLKQILEKNK